MKKAGQVAMLRFPRVDLSLGKPRPILLLAPVPGPYDDWLVCMFSTQLQQAVHCFDEIIDPNDSDFEGSGLKAASLIRVARLAVVSSNTLMGPIGEISSKRLQRIRQTLADWVRHP